MPSWRPASTSSACAATSRSRPGCSPTSERIGDALGLGGRINQENWIEQAQVLAKGGETYYATRRARGEAASAAPTPDEGERRPARARERVAAHRPQASEPLPDVRRARQPLPTGRPTAATSATARTRPSPLPPTVPSAPPAPAAAVPIRPAAPATHDNLLRISGIDAEIERLLTSQGVTRYSQIAHWSPADVERFDRQLGSRRTHRPRELDRAGADPEPRRRHQVLAQLRPGRVDSRAARRQARRRHPGARWQDGSEPQRRGRRARISARCDRFAPRPTRMPPPARLPEQGARRDRTT